MSDVGPSCSGTGFEIRRREDGVATAGRCACDRPRQEELRLQSARVPRRYDHCGLDNFEVHDPSQEAALRLARDWVELWPAVRHGLLFIGAPGTGKTHLAVAIARELVRRKGARVLFYEQRELLKALQGTFDAGATQREAEILGPVLDAEVLLLDDLGAGRTTPWARDVMHDVIAQRYNDEKLLIMTSNHPLGDEPEGGGRVKPAPLDAPLSLRDRLGDALMSRLYEMCRIVPVSGRDYRSGVLHAKHHF
jgi:DNA replication protein DnaC